MTFTAGGRGKRAILAIVVLTLMLAHAVVLSYGMSRVRLPALMIGVVVTLIVMKHVGAGRRVLGLLRKPPRDGADRE